MSKSTISVQLPDSVDRFLDAQARRRLCSKSAVIREILADHLRVQGVAINEESCTDKMPAPAMEAA